MVYCDPETPWTEWSGYEVEVFKRVATIIGIQPEQMTWKCMAWTHMLNELQNNTVCDIAAAGIPVTTESLKMGLQFSVPTFTNGLAIAVSSSYQEASMWAFTAAFSWGVWVAIIGTSMLVGLVVFGIDAIEMGVRKNKEENTIEVGEGSMKKPFSSYIWESMVRPTQARDQEALSVAANVVIFFFAFQCLVLVTIYTANTTANITATRLKTQINGLEDLPGKRVGTWEDYTTELTRYGIVASAYPWDTTEDEDAMFNAIEGGVIQALVLDASLLYYRAANSCDLAVVGTQFAEFNQALVLPSNGSSELMDAINQAISSLREDGSLDEFKSQFVTPPEASCKRQGSGAGTKITFAQVSGLWVLLACGVCIGLFLVVIHKLHKRYTERHIVNVGRHLSRQLTRAVTGRKASWCGVPLSRKSGKSLKLNRLRRGRLDVSGLKIDPEEFDNPAEDVENAGEMKDISNSSSTSSSNV